MTVNKALLSEAGCQSDGVESAPWAPVDTVKGNGNSAPNAAANRRYLPMIIGHMDNPEAEASIERPSGLKSKTRFASGWIEGRSCGLAVTW